MNISVFQFDSLTGRPVLNFRKIEKTLSAFDFGMTDMIVFPEMTDTGYNMEDIRKNPLIWEEEAFEFIRKIAAENQVIIMIGLSEKSHDNIYNTIVILDQKGNIIYKYRKTHLVTISPLCEHLTIAPGASLGLFTLNQVKMGIMTCYELRFPEIARSLTLQGARIIFVPSAWPEVRKDHFTTLLKARAIENQVFIVSANRVGNDGGIEFAGNSMIIDPYGKILAHGSPYEEMILTCAIDLNQIEESRKQISALKERRPDLYTLL